MSYTPPQHNDTEAMIKAAVDYWAGFLSRPDLGLDSEVTDSYAVGITALARSQRMTTQAPDSPEVQKFKDILAGKIRNQLTRADGRLGCSEMTTDYHPQGILLEALREANIGGGYNFKLKDCVIIRPERGTVEQVQVRGSSKTLYSRAEEAKKASEGPATSRLRDSRNNDDNLPPH